jgi:S1-C subfamily serine protease
MRMNALALVLFLCWLGQGACAIAPKPAPLPIHRACFDRPGHVLPSYNDVDGMTRDQRRAFLDRGYASTVEVWQVTTGPDGKPQPFSGTGTVVDDEGSVFTGYHVIERDGPIFAAPRILDRWGKSRSDHTKKVRMRIVAQDQRHDIVWLKPDEKKPLPKPMPMASNRWYVIGERMWQLGQSSGWSFGRVSSLNPGETPRNRYIPTTIEVASTTIAGDSGAPFIDSSGTMVGILVATCFTKKETYFTPIDVAKRKLGYRR